MEPTSARYSARACSTSAASHARPGAIGAALRILHGIGHIAHSEGIPDVGLSSNVLCRRCSCARAESRVETRV